MVEQYLDEEIFSPYVSADNVLLYTPDGACRVVNHSATLVEYKDGVMLDNVHKKVYLYGKKVTHKELRSQSATVEILDVLIDHVGEHVHNSQFPASSYSKNKNEMLGKIILPFKTLMKKEFDCDIQMSCTGSIYDFHVTLSVAPSILYRMRRM